MIPMVDIDTIDAGRCLIAFVDLGGVFGVVSQSAGAVPGQVCYNRGGTEPTSTDAQLLLGRMRPERMLAGSGIDLRPDLATEAMKKVADELKMSVEEAALGALQLQKYGMTQAIEENSVRRGYDPRDFTLVAAGGAGGLFACEIAAELEVPNVLVPANPGIIAALGLLATDEGYEFVSTVGFPLADAHCPSLQASYEELEAKANAQLDAESVTPERRKLQRLADARYEGQGYEIRFDVPDGPIDDAWLAEAEARFHAAHEEEYGHRFSHSAVELINIRVEATAEMAELPAVKPTTQATLEDALIETRDVTFDVGGKPATLATPFYDREDRKS